MAADGPSGNLRCIVPALETGLPRNVARFHHPTLSSTVHVRLSARPLHAIPVLAAHLEAVEEALAAPRNDQSLIYQFYSVSFAQDSRQTGREGVVTGGIHVAACKVTPYERRTIPGRKRPLAARAGTCAAGSRDVHQHGRPSRSARLSRHLGQRQALGAHHEVHGLGRDQIQKVGAGWLARDRMPRLVTPRSRTEEGCTPWLVMIVIPTFRCPIGNVFATRFRLFSSRRS